MKNNYSPEVKQRAIRLMQEQRSECPTQWTAIVAITAKIGCSAETLRSWIKRHEDAGRCHQLACMACRMVWRFLFGGRLGAFGGIFSRVFALYPKTYPLWVIDSMQRR